MTKKNVKVKKRLKDYHLSQIEKEYNEQEELTSINLVSYDPLEDGKTTIYIQKELDYAPRSVVTVQIVNENSNIISEHCLGISELKELSSAIQEMECSLMREKKD